MGKKQVIESLPPGTICLHGWGLTHPIPYLYLALRSQQVPDNNNITALFYGKELGFLGGLGKGSQKMRRNEDQGQKRTTQEHYHLKIYWDEVGHREHGPRCSCFLQIPRPTLILASFWSGCFVESFPASRRSLDVLAPTQQDRGLHPRLAPAF